MIPLSSHISNSLFPITISFVILPMSLISIIVSLSCLSSSYFGIKKKLLRLSTLATAILLFYETKKNYSSAEKAIKIGFSLLNSMLAKSRVLVPSFLRMWGSK